MRLARFLVIATIFHCFFTFGCNISNSNFVFADVSNYNNWYAVGYKASIKAQGILGKAHGIIALTNAGFAEVNNQETKGSLDGISWSMAANVGSNSIVPIHSSPWSPLWFAFYDPTSGRCVYLEIKPEGLLNQKDFSSLPPESIFKDPSVEDIKYESIVSNAASWDNKFSKKVFGGNEFRIITIANAVAMGVPNYVVNSISFHDHYCPGVTSGIFMANWIKKNFSLKDSSYFIQGIDPWCKEDALIMILNATPGKKGYSVTYPTAEDKAKWKPEVAKGATIVYRYNATTKLWDGVVLGFSFATQTGCESIPSSTVQKICADFYYLKFLDTPEQFVTPLHRFTLPSGQTPQDMSRPGVNVMKELGLTIE